MNLKATKTSRGNQRFARAIVSIAFVLSPLFTTFAWHTEVVDTALAAPAADRGTASGLAQNDCFSTGFCIESPDFQEYFSSRGGITILGPAISREFTLDGFDVQFFQRQVLQRQGREVARLNLLDGNMLPVTQANESIFPAPDPALTEAAPRISDRDYPIKVIEFVRTVAADEYSGLPVRFRQLFDSTVPAGTGPADPNLRSLLSLEIWGVPTSRPTFDPRNKNFVYQRFQRGIMHFRATGDGCPCTDGILVGDFLKSVITGQNLPSDLDRDTQFSRYYRQYDQTRRNWVARADVLPGSNLLGAFEPGTTRFDNPTETSGPTIAPATATTVPPVASATPTAGSLSGTVFAVGGAASGAGVEVKLYSDIPSAESDPPRITTLTDPGGRYAMPTISNGPYVVFATAAEGQSKTESIFLSGAPVAFNPRLVARLIPACRPACVETISGRIVDASGKSAVGATVWLAGSGCRGTSGPGGSYTLAVPAQIGDITPNKPRRVLAARTLEGWGLAVVKEGVTQPDLALNRRPPLPNPSTDACPVSSGGPGPIPAPGPLLTPLPLGR